MKDAAQSKRIYTVHIPRKRPSSDNHDFLTMSTKWPAKTSEGVLPTLSKAYSESFEPSKITVENFAGFVRVPIGLAGPLRVRDAGQRDAGQTDDDFFAALATVEPTLVASCSRGCKALQRCGGARFHVLNESMSRAPIFFFSSPDEAVKPIRRRHREHESVRAPSEAHAARYRLQRARQVRLRLWRRSRAEHGHDSNIGGVRPVLAHCCSGINGCKRPRH